MLLRIDSVYSKSIIMILYLFLLFCSLTLKENIEANNDISKIYSNINFSSLIPVGDLELYGKLDNQDSFLTENTSNSEGVVLADIAEDFFRTILLETESGYTLYGEKPLSICDFPAESQLRLGEKKHKDLTTVLAFKNRLKLANDKESNYCLRFSDENDFLLIVINRSAFLQIVQDNLVLFRDRFGVDTTPELFLSHVLDPTVSLKQLFNKNRAILGILLGYGEKNSLLFEKISTLTEPFNNIDRTFPPYQTLKPGINVEETIQIIQQFNFTPSIAYKSIGEELKDIFDRFDCTAKGLPITKPFIRFSFLKDDPDSELLKSKYRLAHKKIHQVLEKDQLRSEFLKKIKISTAQCMNLQNHISAEELNKLIAQYLWIKFSLYESRNKDLFIQGLMVSENDQSEQFFQKKENRKYFESVPCSLASVSEKYKAYNLRERALKLFCERGSVVDVVPNKICYRILKEGKGESLTKKSLNASFRFVFKSCDESSLFGTYSFEPAKEIDLSQTIPGFAYGVLGMKIGEKREIFIDPDFAYGNISHSNFSSGMTVCVELAGMEGESEFIDFPDLFPVDFFQLKKLEILQNVKDVEALRGDSMILNGITAWNFYKNLNVSMELIIKELKNTSFAEIDDINLKKIVDVNYQIYSSNESRSA